MHLNLQTHSGHPHRVGDAVLIVDDELLRNHVYDLPVDGQRQGLGGVDRPLHILRGDLVIVAGNPHHPLAVDAADMVTGDPHKHRFHLQAGHLLRFRHRRLDGGHRLINVHHHPFAQAVGGRTADPHHVEGAIHVFLHDNGTDFGSADIQSGDYTSFHCRHTLLLCLLFDHDAVCKREVDLFNVR